MQEIKVSKISQYIEIIERIKSYYPTGIMINNPATRSFLFRGLCDSTYKLIPGVFRTVTTSIGDSSLTNKKYLAWLNEKGLLQSFIQEASGILNIPTSDILRWAEYAQHYGVPTRFLDWSSNPLVALYFACRDKTEIDGSVWLLHKQNYTRFIAEHNNIPGSMMVKDIISGLLRNEESKAEYPILYIPYYVDTRMSAQTSYFMVWGKKEEPLEDLLLAENVFMDIPEKDTGIRSFGDAQQRDILFRFVISADRKQPLLHELDLVGINEKTLFPGLDGIGRYIERQYRFDYNEAVSNS